MATTRASARSSPRRKPEERTGGLGLALALAMMTAAINAVVVIPLLPELATSFDSSISTAAWSLIAVTLASGVATPIFGLLGDLLGYRKPLLAAFAMLTVGTVVCATASTMAVFLLGRVLQGLVAGALPIAIAVARTHSRPDRVRPAMGVIVGGESLGVGIGFILGGLRQNQDWSTSFWVLLAPAALSLALILFMVPRSAPANPGRFDVVGAALLSVGGTAGALFLLFIGYAQIPSKIAGYGFGAPTLDAGSFLIPDAVAVVIVGLVAGRLAHSYGPRPVMLTGSALVAVTFLLLAPAHDQQWQLFLGSALFGAATALSLTGMYALIAEAIPEEQAGSAQGVNSLVYALGSASGSAAATAILAANLIPNTPLGRWRLHAGLHDVRRGWSPGHRDHPDRAQDPRRPDAMCARALRRRGGRQRCLRRVTAAAHVG